MNKSISTAATTVYLLFFGVSLLEAVRGRDWLVAAVLTVLGVFSVVSDGRASRSGALPGKL